MSETLRQRIPAKGRYGFQQFRTFPYYKVQWYDDVGLCWRDVQKAYSTEAEARAAFLADRTCRVMQVNERGRKPIPEGSDGRPTQLA